MDRICNGVGFEGRFKNILIIKTILPFLNTFLFGVALFITSNLPIYQLI